MKTFLIISLFLYSGFVVAQPLVKTPVFDDWKGQKLKVVDSLTVEGDTLAPNSFNNKVCFLNFYRLGCPPCMIEIGYLNRLKEHYEGERRMRIVSFVSANAEQYKAFLKENTRAVKASSGFDMMLTYSSVPIPEYPVIFSNENNFFSKYKVTGVPRSLILDKNEKVQKVFSGFPASKKDQELWLQDVIRFIDSLLEG